MENLNTVVQKRAKLNTMLAFVLAALGIGLLFAGTLLQDSLLFEIGVMSLAGMLIATTNNILLGIGIPYVAGRVMNYLVAGGMMLYPFLASSYGQVLLTPASFPRSAEVVNTLLARIAVTYAMIIFALQNAKVFNKLEERFQKMMRGQAE